MHIILGILVQCDKLIWNYVCRSVTYIWWSSDFPYLPILNYLPICAYIGFLKFDMKMFVNIARLDIDQLFTQSARRGHPCTLDTCVVILLNEKLHFYRFLLGHILICCSNCKILWQKLLYFIKSVVKITTKPLSWTLTSAIHFSTIYCKSES